MMKGYEMYTKIKQLKEKGFSQNSTAKMLHIHRATVKRYWDKNADEFEAITITVRRTKQIETYETVIINWLVQYQTMSSAQVCDWLKEHYGEDFKERTVSRYVKQLRDEYKLKKKQPTRDYEAVEELPPGQQLQVDFGEKWMKSVNGGNVKIHFAAFVLSHSRYKYVRFQVRPYTTVDLVAALRRCFEYIGGMPQELVFDQDSVVSVSENYGDIIHTYEFEKFRQECKFTIYLCRAADPESKGKIENVVKYIKGNFLENRLFCDEDILNQCVLKWLERTANAKIHGTTKKIPAEVFETERNFLKAVPDIYHETDTTIIRMVRADNTIVYNSNRYSLPLGTYNNQPEVKIQVKDSKLIIYTALNDCICEHNISSGRGMLIKNTNHTRDRESSLNELQEALNELLGHKVDEFISIIRTEKSRYARDQFKLMNILCNKYTTEKVLDAIGYCMQNKLLSVTYVKDYLEYTNKEKHEIPLVAIPVSNNKYHITTEKRSVDAYVKASDNI